ncbi:phage tail protein [Pseudomonas aeruginosa]|uniref:phage tail protein n=1 Tax=Pseudomonas aeruginosa TaxID=287 RepID=UPI0005C4D4ED|nr:phage tail protein [Pseudomonas aeruginosa]MCU9086538.1 phage tail protein [Pseudomonas aeruginosa]MCU9167122.1 phage tail protein [Pseudomonas aeruginosa]MDO5963311.1 phage tail protein [Pseudomonas aeruginosa]OTH34015.1 phage tail protein [Pseudomonas aeruginosa]RPW33109.1 phage tail protein [Pseudomonas aeruginosa]
MAETFSYCTRLGATGETAQRTWQNDFGDGYVQSGGTGINTRSETWDGMTIIGRLEAGDDLLGARAFLDRHEGYRSFLWTPPGGVQGRYRCNGYKLRPLGGGLYELSFTFVQVFYP